MVWDGYAEVDEGVVAQVIGVGLSTVMSLKLVKMGSSRCLAACLLPSTCWACQRFEGCSGRLVVLKSVGSSSW